MSNDRTAEIWSTRLQRELLALTTGMHDDGGKDGDEGGGTKDVALLPPFVTVHDHTLDIAKALCQVTFQIEVVPPSSATTPTTPTAGDDTAEAQEHDATATVAVENRYVLVSLDVSMQHNEKGEVQSSPNTYPFQKPKATLKSGASLFAVGSDVADGDEIEVDCDWTPSLHLSDAALNVALTIRESVRRKEPYFKLPPTTTPTQQQQQGNNNNAIDSLLKKFTAKTNGSKVISGVAAARTKAAAAIQNKAHQIANKNHGNTHHHNHNNAASPPPQRANKATDSLEIGDVINLGEHPYNVCAGMYSCKAIRRPQFVERALAEATAVLEARNRAEQAATGHTANAWGDDDDDDREIPQGLGNYMKLQAGGIKKVAGAGMLGAGSVFKSMLTSAKSVMEESFLMVTDTNLVELKSNKLNVGSATVTFAIPISLLAKLKFRRQESISLFFKQAPDDPLIFMCPDSADAVQQIQIVLKRHGVKGKHTNAATQRAIQAALTIVGDIQAKEKRLELEPTVERVDEIMSLYRQAAERFESAGDARHEEVMNHMRKFLKKPKIASILDGTFNLSPSRKGGPAPQGEVFAPTNCQLDDDDDSVNSGTGKPRRKGSVTSSTGGVPSFDLENDEMDDLDGFLANADGKGKTDTGGDEEHDPVAELDAMFSAADKELAEILSS